jgi:pilus assembly protein CpaE
LAVLPGPTDPEAWDAVALDNVDRLIRLLAEAFDFVVFDTPDVFDAVVKQCVLNSTLTLLVTNLDMSSLADTRAGLRTLQRWDCPPERVRLVVNTTQSRRGLSEADVQQALDRPVFWSVPYERRAADAAQLGESLLLTKPKSDFSRSFHDLAKVVSGSATTSRSGARAGAVRRLFNRRPATATTG